MPDVSLRLGQSLVARVAERHGDRGILMIAGQPIVAQLPSEVRAGDVLRLAVKDVSAEQVIMQMHEGREAAQVAQQQPNVPLAFPGQPPSNIIVDDKASGGSGGEDGDVAAVALTYDSPVLGAMNFRIGMDAANVVVEVRMGAGAPFEAGNAAAGILRAALAEATERNALVNVAVRPGSFDVSA